LNLSRKKGRKFTYAYLKAPMEMTDEEKEKIRQENLRASK